MFTENGILYCNVNAIGEFNFFFFLNPKLILFGNFIESLKRETKHGRIPFSSSICT